MCSRILCSKLAFLQSVLTDNPTQPLRSGSSTASDVMPMSIVKQQFHWRGSVPVTRANQRLEKANSRSRSGKNSHTFWEPSISPASSVDCETKGVDETLGYSSGSWSEWHKLSIERAQTSIYDPLWRQDLSGDRMWLCCPTEHTFMCPFHPKPYQPTHRGYSWLPCWSHCFHWKWPWENHSKYLTFIAR